MERTEKIYNTLLTATEKGFTSLFAQHHEHFYYCALIMMEIIFSKWFEDNKDEYNFDE
jgi:hypothetical protein